MEFGIFDALRIAGALGFFIYGMKVMSEGIQNVAGDKMRNILAAMTTNRLMGVFTGVIITALVQSSSATTVMVVSFVNAGLLNLGQSIGVIMGANIGTTITSWLITLLGLGKFNVSAFALPIIAIGFPMMFSKNVKRKHWAEVIIGFAILFMGLSELKSAMPDLKSNPSVLSFVQDLTEMGYLGIPITVLIGALLTIIVQSSSAAMAITLIMVNQGWIPLELACAIVVGENIGTTITANLAAMIGNVHGKRAARAHFIFNAFGACWMLLTFPYFVEMIKSIMLSNFGEWLTGNVQGNNSFNTLSLSLFHTLFNIVNVLVLISFVNVIKNIVIKMVPPKSKEDEEIHLEYLGEGIISSTQEAMGRVRGLGRTIEKMNAFIKDMLNAENRKDQDKLFDKISAYEQKTDELKAEIANYLAKISENNTFIPHSVELSKILNIIDDLEQAADSYLRIAKAVKKMHAKNIELTKSQIDDLNIMCGLIQRSLTTMNKNLSFDDFSKIKRSKATAIEDCVNELKKQLRKQNIKAIEATEYSLKSGMFFYDIIFSFELLGNHVYNVTNDLIEEEVAAIH
ncbi:Na/Pi cotransporter family protein [Aureibacter tunicatorum]|uniref:Phosphate:Na+ symporter n=1 Tax=Aureibacter tunicatorum TaxID=866807 RepID=A0AAE3XSG1_9BACT|nr:Na/Pi cotransporter family protein [Aureibacter tunicatorum]MDR6241155.1 phosphate:Na+ symporter [Aureibacter tunicatorum]BDD03932.1 hypothetical protein AUTU_14150 [Aureibacter tunicatorum]